MRRTQFSSLLLASLLPLTLASASWAETAEPSAPSTVGPSPGTSASTSPSTSPGTATGTSVACPVVASQLTASQAAVAFALAGRKLAAAAQASKRYPFGALTDQTRYVRTGPTAWTSGFFPGELWSMYRWTGSSQWLRRARAATAPLVRVANDRGTHDLGFMIGVPMQLATQLDPSQARKRAYLNAEITAAKSLARRWNGQVQAIKSADYNGRWGVIIDSAMNAPLMIKVGQLLGPEGNALVYFGEQHMLTLAKHFIRDNGSTFHRMAFNPATGALIGPIAGQGLASTSSTWARGQAWAINGFARSYELTGNPEFLKAAETTANYWMSRVPPGCVPAWDLDVSGNRAPRDSSAAAIAASGLLTLAAREPDAESARTYADYAKLTLGTLASSGWLNTSTKNPGILLQQSLNVPADPRVGSYVWGDYYLLAAIAQVFAPRSSTHPEPTNSPTPTMSTTPTTPLPTTSN
ncbi:MAG TPA: hypothetical protein DDY88_08160 [Actinobacteria bacterium]|nr:hypothetical protein [Actinomycetota bacterium]